METVFKNFVSQIIVGKLIPILAGYFVLKATLDGAAGESPLASIVAALFLMSLSATMQLLQGWNSGGQYATTRPTCWLRCGTTLSDRLCRLRQVSPASARS